MAGSGGMLALHRAALRLQARAKARGAAVRGLPALIFMTDPARTPEPERVAERLPAGGGFVFRAFGSPDALRRGTSLGAIARRRKLVLLAGADPALARAIGAAGVHLPERSAHRARSLKRAHPAWIVTAAAHSLPAARRALASGADAVVLSPVFESRSPSAGRPLGPIRFAALARSVGGPVYALGGINDRTARRLSGAVGLAAVEALAEA